MNCDLLLHWMTHIGQGAWSSFRTAVGKLTEARDDVDDICRRLRIALSDLGYADFFVNDSQRWRVLPPVLAGLQPPAEAAVLTGGRTPHLWSTLVDAATDRGCRVIAEERKDQPASLRLEGERSALAKAAADAGVLFVENFAAAAFAAASPIPLQLQAARVEEAPGNWAPYSFDLESRKWVDGLLRRSACEFRPRYGRSRFYVHTKGGRLLRLDRCENGKRDVVYAAAMIRELALADYDGDAGTLAVPASAPLPELFSRAACLCAGGLATFDNGRLIYRNVPRAIAAVLLVAAGQAYPQGLRAVDAHAKDVEGPNG